MRYLAAVILAAALWLSSTPAQAQWYTDYWGRTYDSPLQYTYSTPSYTYGWPLNTSSRDLWQATLYPSRSQANFTYGWPLSGSRESLLTYGLR